MNFIGHNAYMWPHATDVTHRFSTWVSYAKLLN